MSDPTSDLTLNNVGIELARQAGDKPLLPVVHTIDARMTDKALEKAVVAALELAGDRAPVDIKFEEAHFKQGGAEITAEAGTGRFLKAKATAVVKISAEDSDVIRVQIDEIRAMGKLPVEGLVSPLVEKALAKAAERPGITMDTAVERGLLISPNELLKSQGIDLTFASSGVWNVDYGPGWMNASFRAS